MSKTSQVLYYRVTITVVVDRPERRNATYPVVPAGTVVHGLRSCATRAGAISVYEGILRGEDDFEAEYVAAVRIEPRYASYVARRPPTVRPRMVRDSRQGKWTAAA